MIMGLAAVQTGQSGQNGHARAAGTRGRLHQRITRTRPNDPPWRPRHPRNGRAKAARSACCCYQARARMVSMSLTRRSWVGESAVRLSVVTPASLKAARRSLT